MMSAWEDMDGGKAPLDPCSLETIRPLRLQGFAGLPLLPDSLVRYQSSNALLCCEHSFAALYETSLRGVPFQSQT